MLPKIRGGRWIAIGLYVGVSMLLGIGPLQAQETLTRDPFALAGRLLGVPDDTPRAILDVEAFLPGDTTTFLVNKPGSDTPVPTKALLIGVTSNLYLWVEEGLPFSVEELQTTTQQLEQVWLTVQAYAPVGIKSGSDPVLPLPDVDNNPRLFILFTADVGLTDVAVYNPNDSIRADFAPNNLSNEHELLIVNLAVFPGVSATDPALVPYIAAAMYDILADYYVPDQALWLRDALNYNFFRELQLFTGTQDLVAAYLDAPIAPLLVRGGSDEVVGGQQLFLNYVAQRAGDAVIEELYSQEGEGISALDAVLARHNVTDLVTEQPITARDLFADFVIANLVNQPFGDGRFQHDDSDLIPDEAQVSSLSLGDISELSADAFSLNNAYQDQYESNLLVNQFSTFYVHVSSSQPLALDVAFYGVEDVPRFDMGDDDTGQNQFYWSGRGRNRDHTLTRGFDLRGVEAATLTFDAWYELANAWNYGYVEVSADNGQSWAILPATNTTRANANGVAYGPGFTDISDPNGRRAFPYLGIGYDPETGAISQIVEDGPADKAGLEVGDVVLGYEGEPWPGGVIDFAGLLENYYAGDTLLLLVQKGDEQVDVPLVLGEHPTRVLSTRPQWLPQEVDLSAYAGQQILLRFEYISFPGMENDGLAIDNIAIAQLGYRDDAESDTLDWTLNGWQRTRNSTPQRYLVQVVIADANGFPTAVRQLIGPADTATSGQWTFVLEADESLFFAISGLNDNTLYPVPFDLVLTKTGLSPDA